MTSVHVLLVEDNPGDVRLVREALADGRAILSAELLLAGSLAEALELIGRRAVDVALLDLGLPDGNGVDVVRRLRRNAPGLPLVVVTGSDDEETGLEALRAGAQDYLGKLEVSGPLLRRAMLHAMERVRLDARLAASEARYRTLVRASPDAIVQLDCEGVIDFASPRAMELFGVSREEDLLHTPALEWVAMADRRRAAVELLRAGKGELFGDETYVLRRENGSEFIGEVSAASVCDGHRITGGVVLSIRDITARRRAEDALAESENRLRELTSALGEGIVMRDVEGRVVFMNPEGQRLLGWSDAEARGQDAHKLFHHHYANGSVHPADQCPINASMAEGRRYVGEETFICKDGAPLSVAVISTPILRGGQPAGSVLAFHDISEQLQLRRALEDLAALQQAILDNSMVGIAHTLGGRFSWLNPKFEDLFGYARNELVGQSAECLFTRHEDYHQMQEEARPYMVLADGYSCEHQVRRKDGRLFWCHLSGKRIDPRNPQRGSVWIVRDISLRKAAVNALEDLYRSLEHRVAEEVAKNREKDHLLIRQSRMAAMGEMISYIAHQWRQPLNVLALVHANLRECFETLDADAGARTLADGLFADAGRLLAGMSSTIDDFRNFFRPDRERVDFSLEQSVRDALALVRSSFEAHGIAIAYRADCRPLCHGYPNELSQVLLNLLSNARDAVVDTGQSGAVDIRLSEEDGQACLEISDTGGGIPAEVIERIFDPYFTTKETGTGIGLYMSRSLMEHMGGGIEVENAPHGAVFRLRLPIQESLPPETPSQSQARS